MNFDDLVILLGHVFKSGKIKLNPKRCKLLLTDPPTDSLEYRVKLAEILFKEFSFNSIGFGNQAAMALFGKGATSGVVASFHESSIVVCPVHFYAISKLTKRISVSENFNIAEALFETVQAADSNARLQLFKRILLVSDSQIDALTIENEIKQLYLERVLENDKEKLKKFKIRVEKFPASNDMAFIGGALVARMNKDISEFWVTKEDFEENGSKVLSVLS